MVINLLKEKIDISFIYAFLGEATLGLTFLFYIFLGRYLGPEEFGVFSAAVALGGILSTFIQLGLPSLLTREVAANPNYGTKLTSQFLIIEIFAATLVFLLLYPLATFLGFREEGIFICFLVVLAELCRSIKLTVRGVFRGKNWFRLEAISVSIERSLTIFFSLITLFLTKSLILVVAVFSITRVLDTVSSVIYLESHNTIRSKISFENLRLAAHSAIPFAITTVLWVIYYQVDMVMLNSISSSLEAGYYSASYRVMEIFSALPRVLFYVLFTRFSRLYANQPRQLPFEIRKTTQLLAFIVLPILVVVSFFPGVIIEFLYGETFSKSAMLLSILIPSIALDMFGNVGRQILNATRHEKSLPIIGIATVIINIILNFTLIPSLGSSGAAIATLISNFVLCMMSLGFMSKFGYRESSQILVATAIFGVLLTTVPAFMIVR